MRHEPILVALADPTRRAILDRLREGPTAVGAIAERLPVSRPAVSQHLKHMAAAGLVTMTPSGRRNLYSLAPGGALPLVDWLGGLTELAAPFASSEAGAGLTRAVSLRLSPDEAWHLFCEDLALWWPVATVSVSGRTEGALPQAVVLDARAGGVWREVLFDGTEAVWAEVREADGTRLVLDWRLGTPDGSTVVIGFAEEPGGTRVTLTHDTDAADLAEMWDHVLVERFAAAAASSLSNF
ncbi:ArsR/SmtB family transcription factor [Jannaschia seohaensis]|uniref:Activator of Hsp90 ATPase homolog 1-like protein n=1 Tax=Jannaschia seohaensis TaxID=475081 RepID=A0A2Y9AJC4_9RHOB|nr:metalloregulator ArsR/SmtB family transcription factor [Jannaschia seohaensis]PWJ20495.1 activator of Hsp90 ATPase-like protein [Jannaschia seohaensis]SSA44591.1 Activator of Hsp90 ATPase homolog 1-like protein [Jannaschia seohaensis]